ncbi:MAG: class I SAM-dependent methyltransferase [Planctomycetia bacterium]|nr:class I SAM-dependent methyltransferase [Planctomycetia bacterium]
MHRDRRSDPDAPISRGQPCELCGQDGFQIVARRDRRGRPLESAICRTCGLLSHLRIPSDDELTDYYAREYRHDYHGEITPSAHRVVRAWNVGQRLFKLLHPFLRPDDEVFEVGAGIGCTVKAFALAGYRASGIEPSEGFQRFSREELRVRVRRCSLGDVPPSPTCDFALLVHVIEHFNHPLRSLSQIRRLMRPGGRLYVECPNVAAPHAAPGKLFHFAHVYNFTPETLLATARRAGFELVESLSRPRDLNLSMVFTMGEAREVRFEPGACERPLAAVRRYGMLSYHLRPTYFFGRLRRAASTYGDYVLAGWRMRGIVRRCQRHVAPHEDDSCRMRRAA